MTEEFYHKDLFGGVVDIDLQAQENEEKLPLDKKGREFNIFALTDVFGARRKKDGWVIYQQALLSGLSAEEIFFKIFWQVKAMLLAQNTKNFQEALMKPYPYSKAKGNLKNWKSGELEKLSENLVIGYHQARRGVGDIETLLEKTILGL